MIGTNGTGGIVGKVGNMEDTSLTAFEAVQADLSDKQYVVFCALRDLGEATNQELADYLKWGINRVTPRIFELREKGRVILAAARACKVTGRSANVWKIDGVY